MVNRTFGSWLGPALGVTGIAVGFAASDAVHTGEHFGLLVGSLCAVWGFAFMRRFKRAA